MGLNDIATVFTGKNLLAVIPFSGLRAILHVSVTSILKGG